MEKILILEPYYGGSHKLFLTGLQQSVKAEYTLLTLPARKWKMRMQLSALWFVEQISQLPLASRSFTTVLCSTFVDVAVLRSLLLSVPGWDKGTRFCTYFHENQFAYPTRKRETGRHQFTSINFTTAMASDSCAFNSYYNLESFLAGIHSYLKKVSDMKFREPVTAIREKSSVLYPGMEYSFIDQLPLRQKEDGAPVIVWNHRWEHDKGPEIFFEALYCLQEQSVAFRLIVLGQSFVTVPPCFQEAKVRLAREIIHFGFAESQEEYARLLKLGDILVSTAKHEFFGISVLEGIRAGCYPILPADLSYPELYEKQYLYEPGKLAVSLEQHLQHFVPLDAAKVETLTGRFAWSECGDSYAQWLLAGNEKMMERI